MDGLLYYILIFAFWYFLGIPFLRAFINVFVLKKSIHLPTKEPVEKCPPHKWDYDAQGQMYCKRCPRKPGQ